MQVNWNDDCGGISLREVRWLLRKLLRYTFSWRVFPVEFGLPEPLARSVVGAMEGAGLLKNESGTMVDGSARFSVTPLGQRMAAASLLPRISRAKIEKKYNSVVDRASVINADSRNIYIVSRIGVFGSALFDNESYGDIDILLDLDPRCKDLEIHKRLCVESLRGGKLSHLRPSEAQYACRKEVVKKIRSHDPYINPILWHDAPHLQEKAIIAFDVGSGVFLTAQEVIAAQVGPRQANEGLLGLCDRAPSPD